MLLGKQSKIAQLLGSLPLIWKTRMGFRLLAMGWPRPRHCSHCVSEPAEGRNEDTCFSELFCNLNDKQAVILPLKLVFNVFSCKMYVAFFSSWENKEIMEIHFLSWLFFMTVSENISQYFFSHSSTLSLFYISSFTSLWYVVSDL